ncbi:hypothetical protein [Lentzea terrae]|uniref:hypothetical protein n=1 Tax=Lentzea terrae TaxID=2200761 RepID=UPI000DD3A34A|nr:hypothetical protein [Lentzea terrae]
MTQDSEPCRVGVVILPARKMNLAAIQFLILAMNKEQTLFQFEFYNFGTDTDPLLELLDSRKTVGRKLTKRLMLDFVTRSQTRIRKRSDELGLSEGPPDRFVIVSQCRFDDNFYTARSGGVSVIALGNWKRFMAPPSFVEFVQALLVREAIAALCPSLRGSVHLGTKGCLLDFTEHLSDARQKVLRGYVCHHCSSRMQEDEQPALADAVTHLLDRQWLGQPTDPRTPAGVMVSLRYDLFTAKGRQETPKEAFLTALRQEGAKQITTGIGALILAVLFFFLGLKTGGR